MTASTPSVKNLLYIIKIWSVCLFIPEILVWVVSIFRLILRRRTSGLWWDDYFSLLASVLAVPFFAMASLPFLAPHISRKMQVNIGWIVLLIDLMVLCTARISLALSIARILPPTDRTFRVTVIFCWIYAFCCGISILQLVIICEATRKKWENSSPRTCRLPNIGAAIFPYAADVASDLFLVGLALRQFWNIKLRSKGARILVLTGFAATLLVSPLAFVVGLMGFIPAGLTPVGITARAMSTHMLGILALVACNALVVMSYIYQRLHKHDDELVSELTALSRVPTNTGRRTASSDADSFELNASSDPYVLTDIDSEWSTSQLRSDDSRKTDDSNVDPTRLTVLGISKREEKA
ncbi:hypothetical protein CPB83DRAFT_903397 [Crepidotus variabilis]|uniref:Rhodopsin domain-containing protein n=1 Tax=Crepidotus variabilis TaxID=179855 RepID=A0A9P6JUW1_9AGAR|nr:hypothetical protein CPB83DRAFT_903397 [Crepidotus variabilis]